VLKIISAPGIPLRGWVAQPEEGDLNLTDIESDPFGPGTGQDGRVTGTEVHYAINKVREVFGPLRGSLIGSATNKFQNDLESRARQLRRFTQNVRGDTNLPAATAGTSAHRLWLPFENDCEKWAERLEYMAALARKEPKQERALVSLVPAFEQCYRQLYNREPTGGWRHDKDRDNGTEANSPFLLFAQAFLVELGCPLKCGTIQKAMYTSRQRPAPLEKST
jgi:hypothetical protein